MGAGIQRWWRDSVQYQRECDRWGMRLVEVEFTRPDGSRVIVYKDGGIAIVEPGFTIIADA